MFELSFSFSSDKGDHFNVVNAALSNLELSDLEITKQEGSLIRWQYADPNLPDRFAYVFSEFAVNCKQEKGAKMFHFQFDPAVLTWEECAEVGSYMEKWKKDHPDRCLCWVQKIDYPSAEATVFIVLHHEKEEE